MFSALGSVGGFFIGNLYNNYINEDKKWLQELNGSL
jgi:hypothetical protein